MSPTNNISKLSRLTILTKDLHLQTRLTICQQTIRHNGTKTTSTDNDNGADVVETFKHRLPKDLQSRLGPDLERPNGFKLFDIEERFKIDEIYLRREMRKLQNLLHPDRFVDHHILIQEQSNKLSAVVNNFYKILSHPYERGRYLFGLMTNKSEVEVEEILDRLQLDSEFLAKMMEISEMIHCPTTEFRKLTQLQYDLDHELKILTDELNADFEKKNTDDIIKKLGTLKFVANCHKALAERMGSFSNF